MKIQKKKRLVHGMRSEPWPRPGLHIKFAIDLFQVENIWPIVIERVLNLSCNLLVTKKLIDFVFNMEHTDFHIRLSRHTLCDP